MEFDDSGNPVSINLFGPDGLEARQDLAGNFFWNQNKPSGFPMVRHFTYDPQGNLVQRFLDDVSGNFTVETSNQNAGGYGYVFDAFGDERQGFQVSDASDQVGFGGQWGYYTDHAMLLDLMTHRYYNPATGRWVTRDPIGYNGGLNLYAFCGNNPVTGADPSGNAWYNPNDPDYFGFWLDNHLLDNSISDWGTVQGQYDSGRATLGQLNAARFKGSAEVVFLATTVVGVGAGARATYLGVRAAGGVGKYMVAIGGNIAYKAALRAAFVKGLKEQLINGRMVWRVPGAGKMILVGAKITWKGSRLILSEMTAYGEDGKVITGQTRNLLRFFRNMKDVAKSNGFKSIELDDTYRTLGSTSSKAGEAIKKVIPLR